MPVNARGSRLLIKRDNIDRWSRNLSSQASSSLRKLWLLVFYASSGVGVLADIQNGYFLVTVATDGLKSLRADRFFHNFYRKFNPFLAPFE